MKKVSCLLLIWLFHGSVWAAAVDLSLWEFRPTGTVSDGGEPLSLRDDLGLGDQIVGLLHVTLGAFELAYAPIDLEGRGARGGGESSGTVVGGLVPGLETPEPGGGDVATRAKLDDVQLRALWRFWGRSGVGASLRWLSGSILVERDTESRLENVDELFPMLSVNLESGLTRSTAFRLVGDWIRYGDDEVHELRLELSWRQRWFQAALGLLEKSYDVQSGDFSLDARQVGPFLRAGVVF